ncbi:oligosaccharide flippase family protein [Actinomycetospora chiangmaiensis]|uniref:oligosaccharide flippase family protein n=1 Tax=Actinomycetospora chiangmaiensis TaxID=402650 RepID=UPI0003A3B216|nr:oligosaccharide flippase family protein [Actinomycetospora chiangmaiensis]
MIPWRPRVTAETVGLARTMALGALGPALTFVALFALPLGAAALLSTTEFAMWTVLSTITTISVTLDLGGTALVMARWRLERRGPLLRRAAVLSGAGSVLVGVVAAIAFVPFSRTAAAAAFTFVEGLAAIGLVTVGCTVRSAVTVLAQAALSDGRFRARTVLFTTQAFGAAVLALALAAVTGSAWALPLGWSAASTLTFAGGLVWTLRSDLLRGGPTVAALPDGAHRVSRFAWARTGETVLSSLLVQSDRWIVGALGGPHVLAAYEIAARLASMPKFLSFQLAPAVAGQAVESAVVARRPAEVRAVLRRGLAVCAAAMLAASVAFTVGYPLAAAFTHVDVVWPVFAAMLVAYFLYGLTSPVTVVGISVDRPAIDVPFLLLALVGAAAATAAAFATGDVAIYVVGNLAALTVGALWFFRYAPATVAARARALAVADVLVPSTPGATRA